MTKCTVAGIMWYNRERGADFTKVKQKISLMTRNVCNLSKVG